MTRPQSWSADTALASALVSPWQGRCWRAHRRRYAATDPGGSRRVSGRYNRGLDQFPEDQIWPALYLSLGPEVCLGEVLRHVTPELLPFLNEYRLTELSLELENVLDCRHPSSLGLELDDLCDEADYRVTQEIAAAAIARGVEGILVPSATRLGDNLIVFPSQLRSDSQIIVLNSREPRLYVSRSEREVR